jgi:hypothetical protein
MTKANTEIKIKIKTKKTKSKKNKTEKKKKTSKESKAKKPKATKKSDDKIKKSDKMSSTSRLRNTSKQSSFRKKSGATKKEEKHVAHTLDLELAKFISNLSHGKEDTDTLKVVLNHKSNFQMSMIKTNLVDHKECAQGLMEKYKSGVPLNTREEKRARHQVKFIKLNKKLWPEGFKNGCIKFYKELKTKDNKTLIDLRLFQ